MDYPQGLSRKKVLAIIKKEVADLPEAKYTYNVYGMFNVPGVGMKRIKIGTEKQSVNHKRRAFRQYKRKLHEVTPKLKTSKRQIRLLTKKQEENEQIAVG